MELGLVGESQGVGPEEGTCKVGPGLVEGSRSDPDLLPYPGPQTPQ